MSSYWVNIKSQLSAFLIVWPTLRMAGSGYLKWKVLNVETQTFNKWHVSWELSLSLTATHLSRSTRAEAIWLASGEVWRWLQSCDWLLAPVERDRCVAVMEPTGMRFYRGSVKNRGFGLETHDNFVEINPIFVRNEQKIADFPPKSRIFAFTIRNV